VEFLTLCYKQSAVTSSLLFAKQKEAGYAGLPAFVAEKQIVMIVYFTASSPTAIDYLYFIIHMIDIARKGNG